MKDKAVIVDIDDIRSEYESIGEEQPVAISLSSNTKLTVRVGMSTVLTLPLIKIKTCYLQTKAGRFMVIQR